MSLSTINVSLEGAQLDSHDASPNDSLEHVTSHANMILPLITEASVGDLESRSKLLRYTQTGRCKVIVLVHENEASNLSKSLEKESIFQTFPKVVFTESNYRNALSHLAAKIAPKIDVEQVYASIEANIPDNRNPFRRIRSEHYEDLETLALFFAEPDKERYGKLTELKPTIIVGGRGCGKSMLLKSLQALVAVRRINERTIKKARLHYFGVYCRLDRSPFAATEEKIQKHLSIEGATRLYSTLIVLQLTQAIIEEIKNCSSLGILDFESIEESQLVKEISTRLVQPHKEKSSPNNLQQLERLIESLLHNITEYIGRRTLGEEPAYSGIFLERDDLRKICKSVVESVSDLANSTVYFLMDEYENLLRFQKVVVNTFLKWSEAGSYTIKVATKKTGFQETSTLEEQEIEEPDDYTLLDCDYDLGDSHSRALYRRQLKRICSKILAVEKISTPIDSLLEKGRPVAGLSDHEISLQVQRMAESLKGRSWATISPLEQEEYLIKFKTAAIYRALKAKRRQFSGLNDFALLSSGIIRHFLELCGMAYYFALRESHDIHKGSTIPPKFQTEAAFALSSYYLANIRKNISTHGPAVQQLVIDLGDVLHYKLMRHPSAPEAALLSIVDSQNLLLSSESHTKEIIDSAILHGVIQTPTYGLGGNRPPGYGSLQPADMVLNRIYAPELRFSPRTRWSTNIEVKDLSGLLNPETRRDVKTRLISKIPISIDADQARLTSSGFLDSNDPYETVED